MGKTFKELDIRLRELYIDAEAVLIRSDANVKSFKGVMSKFNSVYAEMERLTINELDSSRKASLTSSMQAHHVVKAKFYERATTWLKAAKLDEKDVCNVMTATHVLRSHSQRRATTDSSSSRSTTSRFSNATHKTSSSSSLARSISKEERAKLKVAQLKEKQHLLQIQAEKRRQSELEEAERKHQQDREKAERKHQQELEEAELRRRREQEEADLKLQMEMLDASHAEQAATVHR